MLIDDEGRRAQRIKAKAGQLLSGKRPMTLSDQLSDTGDCQRHPDRERQVSH